MGILQIVTRNFGRGSRTRRPTDEVAYPEGYRGALVHGPELCTGCKTCAHVCSPGAITFDEHQPDSVAWEYFTGQCTFCGRCVEYCPCRALSFAREAPPLAREALQQRVSHRVFYQRCHRCDRPIMPLHAQVLARLYHHTPTVEVVQEQKLCEDCRRELTGARIKKALHGQIHE